MDCSMPGFPVIHRLPEFAQTHAHWVGDAIQQSHPLSLPSPPALSLSQHQGLVPMSWWFASGGKITGASALASVLPMDIQDWCPLELTGLNSLVQMILKSLQYNSKALILEHSAFFMVQLSHPYKTTGKSIALTIWTFVGKVMSLLFNMLSRFVRVFLPRKKCLFISWLQ